MAAATSAPTWCVASSPRECGRACCCATESDNSALDGLDVERVYGDLRDPAALAAAVRGVERVYHCAAKISTVGGGEHEIFDCNVIGTRNLLARRARGGRPARGRHRIVLARSATTPIAPSDENDALLPVRRSDCPTSAPRCCVEHECWKAVAEGQDVVVATSCAILGPNDYMPSRMGAVAARLRDGKLRAYIPGGFEFVAARDIVEGHVLAMEKGRTGQKYIFGSGFVTVDELMDDLRARSPASRGRACACRRPLMVGDRQRRQPVLTRFFPQRAAAPHARRGAHPPHAPPAPTCTKAQDASSAIRPTPIADAIREAYEDFVARGLDRTSPRAAAGARRAPPSAAPRSAREAASANSEPMPMKDAVKLVQRRSAAAAADFEEAKNRRQKVRAAGHEPRLLVRRRVRQEASSAGQVDRGQVLEALDRALPRRGRRAARHREPLRAPPAQALAAARSRAATSSAPTTAGSTTATASVRPASRTISSATRCRSCSVAELSGAGALRPDLDLPRRPRARRDARASPRSPSSRARDALGAASRSTSPGARTTR